MKKILSISVFAVASLWILFTGPEYIKERYSAKPINEGTAGQQNIMTELSIEGIPQGKMIFELSQYNRQINTQVEVGIEGNNITVYNSETNPLSGGKVIIEGIILKHESGQWIIGNHDSDKTQEEIGGCTGGPIPIDFEAKMIEWC